MNHTAPSHEPAIRPIALDRLSVAPENVRKAPPDAAAEAELKASIAAHGLLENLVVRGESSNGHYAVVAGGRRLAALKALAADGVLDAAHPVPCLVVDNTAQSSELSLAENVIRIAMHPADQVTAFTKLAESGISVAAIAARFGISERLVEQRLRLGNAAPELLDAYRNDRIDLETLKAFAVTTDHGRQAAVWEEVANQGYRPAAWQVKRLLTEERVPANSAMARFVGVGAYEAAGGAVLRDLFADEDESGIWLEDLVLLQKLAMEKLGEAVKELETRWRWATAMPEVDWTSIAHYGRISPEPSVPTDEETAELERLRIREDELADLDEDEWTEALGEEAQAIETRTCEIHEAIEARAAYQAGDYAIAGCIATIGRDGELQVIGGLVRPEDMPKPADAGNEGEGDGDDATGSDRLRGPSISGPLASPPDPEAEARKEAGVGIGLSDDLRSIRTALVKAHLGKDFEAAFDLMLFQLGRSVFTHGYKAHALDIAIRETPDRPTLRMNDQDFDAWSPGEAMLDDRSGLPLDWLTVEDDGEPFAALRALPEADKQALFAAAVARTVKGQLAFEPGARPELEATVARLGIDFAGHVRPTAAMLWSRINKGRILEIAR
ncbi:MAG: ParB N-terminal domain-containing protein, partial [Acidobacteriota bacterium]|nr:ParB N-terminal domain-containing protein [Acidobacteriota bacterium]